MNIIVYSIILSIIGFFEHAEDYAQKYLPEDCYKVHSYPERITTFYWFFPLDKTNIKNYDQAVEIAKEAASTYFREVNVVESPCDPPGVNAPVGATIIKLIHPFSSFNEATNIDHCAIGIKEFCPAGTNSEYLCFSFTTKYDVIYPYYSGREIEDIYIRIPIKHKGKLNAIRPKDRNIFKDFRQKIGNPPYIESFDTYLMVKDIKEWPKFETEFPPKYIFVVNKLIKTQ